MLSKVPVDYLQIHAGNFVSHLQQTRGSQSNSITPLPVHAMAHDSSSEIFSPQLNRSDLLSLPSSRAREPGCLLLNGCMEITRRPLFVQRRIPRGDCICLLTGNRLAEQRTIDSRAASLLKQPCFFLDWLI